MTGTPAHSVAAPVRCGRCRSLWLAVLAGALFLAGCPSRPIELQRLRESDRSARRRLGRQLREQPDARKRLVAEAWLALLFDGRIATVRAALRRARAVSPAEIDLDWIELLSDRQGLRTSESGALLRLGAHAGPYQEIAWRLLEQTLRVRVPFDDERAGWREARRLAARVRSLTPAADWTPASVARRRRLLDWLRRRGVLEQNPRREPTALELHVDRQPLSPLLYRDLTLEWFRRAPRTNMVARRAAGGRIDFPRPGVYRVELSAPKEATWLQIESSYRLRVRVGRRIVTHDPENTGPNRFVPLDGPTSHGPLALVVAVTTQPLPLRLRFVTTARRRTDDPLKRPCSANRGSRELWLEGWRALQSGAGRRARRCLGRLHGRLPSNPLLSTMLAEAVLLDTSYPRSERETRALALLRQALRRDPAAVRPALRTSELDDKRGQSDAALDRLQALRPRERELTPIALARASLLAEKGRVIEARDALEQSLKRSPSDCRIATEAVRFWREQREVVPLSTWRSAGSRLRRWLSGRSTCRALELQLALLDRASGRDAQAIERYRRLLARQPEETNTRLELARLLLRGGESKKAASELRDLLRQGSPAELARWLLAALRLSSGRSLRRSRPRLDLVRRLTLLGAPLLPTIAIADGRELLRRFLTNRSARARTKDSGAVIIWRQRVSRFLANGGEIRFVHHVVRLQDREAVDRFGELRLPPTAELWRVRTLKANGDVLPAEGLDDKDTISLRALAVGDAIEYAYFTFSRQTPRLRGSVESEAFTFQHPVLPTIAARYDVLVAEPRIANALRWETRCNVDPPKRALGSGFHSFAWTMTAIPPLRPEPHGPSSEDQLCQVRVTTLTGDAALRRWLEDWLAERLTSNDALDAAIAHIARSERTVEGRIRAAYHLVQRRLRVNEGDLGSSTTGYDFVRRRGNRSLLLKLILDRLAIPSELALIRPYTRPVHRGELPNASPYEHAVVHLQLGSKSVWIDPAWVGAPIGYLMPGLQGRPALLLRTTPGDLADRRELPPLTRTPRFPLEGEGRRISIAGRLGAVGNLELRVVEELRGREAISYRLYFAQRSQESRRLALERVLRSWFPGASLSELQLENVDRPLQPLRIRYRARGALGPTRSLGFGALYDIESLARRAQRRHALLIENPRNVAIDLRLTVDPRWRVDLPKPRRIATHGLRFRLDDRRLDNGQILLVRRLRLTNGVIEPRRYLGWVRAVRLLVALDSVSFERRR